MATAFVIGISIALIYLASSLLTELRYVRLLGLGLYFLFGWIMAYHNAPQMTDSYIVLDRMQSVWLCLGIILIVKVLYLYFKDATPYLKAIYAE